MRGIDLWSVFRTVALGCAIADIAAIGRPLECQMAAE